MTSRPGALPVNTSGANLRTRKRQHKGGHRQGPNEHQQKIIEMPNPPLVGDAVQQEAASLPSGTTCRRRRWSR